MKKLTVKASKPYSVYIGENALNSLVEILDKDLAKKPNKVLIVSDSNVYAIYGERVKGLLDGYAETYSFVFTAGEQSKTLETAHSIITTLAENEFTRTDLLVALGGGVTGDITGFVAGIYLRGVDFVQIPTTMLASIDSSVGGKTGVDIPEGKNLVGAFHQPKAVVCDTEIIRNLPTDIYSQGMAEAIKYGVLDSEKLFYKIQNKTADLDELIYACVKIKANIVKKDEFDGGLRQLLNLGHTFGHAIERLSAFKLSHGEAVGIGMLYASEYSVKIGLATDKNLTHAVKNCLLSYGLPLTCEFTKTEIFGGLLLDKKRRGNSITLVLPQKIGKCKLVKTDIEKFKETFLDER